MSQVHKGAGTTCRPAMFFVFVLLLAQCGLLVFSLLQHITAPAARYYALTPSGDQVELARLAEPSVDNRALLRWATLAATTAFTLDFVHYQTTLNSLKDYFTNDGYDSLMAAMQDLDYFKDIEARKLYLTAVATEPSTILRRGKVHDLDAWFINVHLLITIQTGGMAPVHKRNQVIMMVTRVPTQSSRTGLGIAQFIQTETAI